MKHAKLSDKLALLCAALFVVIFFLLSAGVLFSTYEALYGDKQEYLYQTMSIIQSHILEEYDEGIFLTSSGLLEEESFDLNLNIFIYSPQGSIVNKLRNFHMVVEEIPSGKGIVHMVSTKDDGILISLKSDLYDGETPLGSVLLVSRPVNELSFLKLLGILLLGANVVGAVAAGFVGSFVSRRMLAPIDGMIREAAEIDSRNLKRRLAEPVADDELKRLASTINTMLGRVDNAFEQQSRFAADASHELRTPLSVIRGYIDLLQRWGKSDQKILQEGLDAISRQTEYMQKLVENLLFLARGDIGQWDVSKQSFSVKDLMEELLGEQSAMDPAHRYMLSAEDDIVLQGDRNMIKQMLLALLDNSRKYTQEGGEIMLISELAGEKVRLTVKDTGIGMKEEQLTHIFERFYRADKSRSRKDGSAGLGLSIVAAIAQLHAAEISAESSPDQGTSISIVFPNLKRPYVSR